MSFSKIKERINVILKNNGYFIEDQINQINFLTQTLIDMKAVKRLLIAMVSLLLSVEVFAYDFEVDGLYFNLTSLPNRTCKLTSGSSKYSGSLIIPDSVNYEGLFFKVTELDPYAFNSKITELSIPATITTIPKNTISECELSKLIFVDGQSPLKVDDYVTSGGGIYGPTYWQPLQYLYLGRNLTNHGSFYDSSSLTEIKIGPYVTEIPSLNYCNKLESIYIPDNVTHLGGFRECFSLRKVFIGNGVTVIPGQCFYECTSLENVYLGNNVSEIEGTAFYECKKLINLFIFSDKLTTIGANALPKTISKIYVPNPSRYDNLLNEYYRESLISLNNSLIEYSGKLPNFSYKSNVVEANISFSLNGLNYSVGSYHIPVKVIFQFENGWSTSSYVEASYTITPAPLTIIANDASRKYGEENPELTCSYYGFKNNENEEVLTQKAQLVTNAVASSNVGTYSIIPINAEAQNYSMVYERGTLTITQADQTITWDDDVYYAVVGEQIELTAISTSGLEIKYEVSDESLAEIYRSGGKQFIDCLKSGEVTIKAYQDGNENFKPADRLTKKLIIKDKVVQAENISLSKSSISLRKGESYKLIATIYPENATSKEVVWKSSNENIVAISNTGVVTALEEGATTIVATTVDGSNLSAICDVVVQPTLAESLILDKSELTLNVSEKIMLVATISPTSIPNKELRWTSSNDAIATVDKGGVVTAIATGEAIITVATTDGSNLSASCKVTVVPTLVESITLDKTEINLEATQTAELTATVLPELATNKVVTWKSSDESAAIVDANGVVTAIALGESVITATTTDGTNLSATCKVTVVPTLAETITLDKTEISLEATETATLIVTVLPELTTDKSVEWSSSNEAVAVVDENGVVTAVAVGEATITATTVDDSNLSASCKVSVVPTLAVSIELDQTEASVEEKSDLQLIATILPEHTTNKEVAWSSSDKWVASVDNYGLVTMYSAGEVIITAATTDGTNLSATCRINVYSGIDGVNGDDVIVATVGDNIVVKNAKLGSVVNVYASNGELIASKEATDGSVVVEAPVKGIYVVKVGKQTVKVII